MRGNVALMIALGTLYVIASGCASSPIARACPDSALTEQRVRDIAVAEFERHGGIFREAYWNYRVTAEHCRIFFDASHEEARTEFHFSVELDKAGNVVLFIPGS